LETREIDEEEEDDGGSFWKISCKSSSNRLFSISSLPLSLCVSDSLSLSVFIVLFGESSKVSGFLLVMGKLV
jgi:hypothetical protein